MSVLDLSLRIGWRDTSPCSIAIPMWLFSVFAERQDFLPGGGGFHRFMVRAMPSHCPNFCWNGQEDAPCFVPEGGCGWIAGKHVPKSFLALEFTASSMARLHSAEYLDYCRCFFVHRLLPRSIPSTQCQLFTLERGPNCGQGCGCRQRTVAGVDKQARDWCSCCLTVYLVLPWKINRLRCWILWSLYAWWAFHG